MFKNKLRKLREDANLTQKELGEKIFASRSAVSKWELGNGMPSDINICALCKLFSVSKEWLLDGENLKRIAEKKKSLLNQKEKDYILEYYSEFNNEECGKWNTSIQSKWYDYNITKYFEENFSLKDAKVICNIGIGPGHWDRYLSYHMNEECRLISVDIDTDITETFRLCLENEQNSRNIEIVNKNIFEYNPKDKFDIVTMVRSTVQEIGKYNEIFKKVTTLLNDEGELYYSCVSKNEIKEQLFNALKNTGYIIDDYQRVEKYGLVLIVCKIKKP